MLATFGPFHMNVYVLFVVCWSNGQLVGRLNYYNIDEIKKDSYGVKIKSNYHNQNLKLAKQFK